MRYRNQDAAIPFLRNIRDLNAPRLPPDTYDVSFRMPRGLAPR